MWARLGGRLRPDQAYEEEGVGMRCEEVSNSIPWISKQKLGFGALMRFQLPIHIHPNIKSGNAVYFSFLDDLILRSISIPKGPIHASKQNLTIFLSTCKLSTSSNISSQS
jgi:hypothetical protein